VVSHPLGRPRFGSAPALLAVAVAAGVASCAEQVPPAPLVSGVDTTAPVDAQPAPEPPPDAGPEGGAPVPRDPDAGRDLPLDRPDEEPDARTAEPDGPPLRCNGHPELCDRRFDEVVFPTTHNAMSNADDRWFIANQTHNMRRQLRDGIRAMLIDTHRVNGQALLCHTNCAFGSRPLGEALGDIEDFLRENPREVVALIIEDYLGAAETGTAFAAAGLTPLLHVGEPGSAWPTLRQMIASDRRLVVAAQNGRPPPAWYHHLWDLVWDTPYTFRNPDEFSCRQNRGQIGNALFLLNHWVEDPLPDPRLSARANSREVLLERARRCQSERGKLPNFVAVNHYSIGALFEVVRELNRL
jgi:hypothetical protein